MIARVEVPFLDAAVKGGVLSKWRKRVGDEIGYGDAICDIAVDEWVALRKTKRARLLVKLTQSEGLKGMYDTVRGRGMMNIRLVSAEPARLERVLIDEGARIGTGDLIALADIGKDGAWETNDPSSLPSLRVVAQKIDSLPSDKL
jgi:hypothetical protein